MPATTTRTDPATPRSHPAPPPPASASASERSFETADGTRIFYRAWNAVCAPQRSLVLFHGGHEHSGRFDELVARLDLPRTAVFAWDARGHGRSDGERGDAPHFHRFAKDAEEFVRHLEATHGLVRERAAVLGHSVGSVVAATWIHDWAPPVVAAVLGSPAFHVKLYVPFALSGLRVLRRFKPGSSVKSYVRPGMLTHDRAEADARRADEMISPRIAVRVLTSLFDTSRRVIDGAGSIRTPTLVLSAGADRVVHQRAQRRFFERLGADEKRFVEYPGFYHELFHEKDRHLPIAAAREFLLERFAAAEAAATVPPQSLAAVESGWRRRDELATPLPIWSPRGLLFRAQKAALRTVGRLSEGFRLGWRTGFDSGLTLDYVYRNRARGWTALGRAIDRTYLDSVGWRGIRERKRHLEEQLRDAIEAVLESRGAAHVVDLAGGPGRYLLDALVALDDPRVSVLVRDRDEQGLAAGREAWRRAGFEHVDFEAADAFDPESIARLEPRPDVVVVSGLWELFAANDGIERSLRALREVVPVGGSLVYTNQPHHPQLEFIARVLTNRDGESWVMRPRSQAEIDALVARAGFRKVAMAIDDDGIFSVSRAVRCADGSEGDR